MLSLVEEVLLLALDDEKGTFGLLPRHAMEFALASSTLMDLALHGRIDTDLEALILVSDEPLGDDILDPILAAIARSDESFNAKRWISVLAQEAGTIRARALDRLVERGVLRRDQHRVLWVVGPRRYPVLDDAPAREVRERILAIVLSDEIPDPRDVVLVSLADACDLFGSLLGRKRAREAAPRIKQVARMDLIGRSLLVALCDMRDWGRWAGSPRERIWDVPGVSGGPG